MELKDKVGTNKATSSVLLYNIMHMFSHIVFWMVSVILIILFMHPGTNALIACAAIFIIFFLMSYWVFTKYKKGLLLVTFTALSKVPLIKGHIIKLMTNKKANLEEIDKHIIELFSLRIPTFYSALAFEFIARVIGCLEIYFIGRALQIDISLLDSIIVSAGSSLFANMIFFSPMQLGAREGGFVLALKGIGIGGGIGITMSLITRIRELVWIMIGLLLMRMTKPVTIFKNK